MNNASKTILPQKSETVKTGTARAKPLNRRIHYNNGAKGRPILRGNSKK